MEKKKLLLVAVSVGLFLVITIGAALVVFAPKNGAAPSTAASRPGSYASTGALPPSYQPAYQGYYPALENPAPAVSPQPLDPVDLVRNPAEVPGLQARPEGSLPPEGDFYVSASPGTEGGTVISVRNPSAAGVPEAPPSGRAVSPSAASRPAPSSPVQSAPSTTAPRTTAAPPVQARPAVQTRVHDDYWVQTGAFSTIVRAEGVKENLSSRGITSIIENREVNGQTVFRVRVGPYTSQNEADYWLSLIQSIDGFGDSQIRMTQSQR